MCTMCRMICFLLGTTFCFSCGTHLKSLQGGSNINIEKLFGVLKESRQYEVLGNVLNECIRDVCRPETLLQDHDRTCVTLNLVLNDDAFAMHSRYCVFATSSRTENRLDCTFLKPLELISAVVTKDSDRDDITKIALLVPSTTKGVLIESVWELPILNTFLPSFLHTIATCDRADKETFHFAIYLAYDFLDEFYDRPIATQSLRIAFGLVIQESRRLFGLKHTPSVELRLYRSHGELVFGERDHQVLGGQRTTTTTRSRKRTTQYFR